jgi:transposase
MIPIEQYWLATEPIDMRAGMQTMLGKVVSVFGSAQANHAYLFTNRRGTRIKVLVSDEFGLWLMTRQLYEGAFRWQANGSGTRLEMTESQFEALVLGLPWQRVSRRTMVTAA